MNIQQLLHEASGWFDEKVQGIPPTKWNESTPCSDWTVTQLVTHLIDEEQWMPPVLQGKSLQDAQRDVDALETSDDLKLSWKNAYTDAGAAIDSVNDLSQTVHLSFGDFPAEFYMWQLLTEHVIHGWDLAHATAQDEMIPTSLSKSCLEWFETQEEWYRNVGIIAPRPRNLSTEASPQDRLLNMFGRDPSGS